MLGVSWLPWPFAIQKTGGLALKNIGAYYTDTEKRFKPPVHISHLDGKLEGKIPGIDQATSYQKEPGVLVLKLPDLALSVEVK